MVLSAELKTTVERNIMKKSYIEAYEQANQAIGEYAKASPKLMKAFMGLHHIGAQDGALPAKYKELVALGIGIHTKCEGCIMAHVHHALELGATHEEIVEAINVAVYMGGGPSVAYGAKAYAALQEFEKNN
jgi:AhpD family alkylhydroperoxidase